MTLRPLFYLTYPQKSIRLPSLKPAYIYTTPCVFWIAPMRLFYMPGWQAMF
jgi:hypothetical protein